MPSDVDRAQAARQQAERGQGQRGEVESEAHRRRTQRDPGRTHSERGRDQQQWP